MLTPHLESIRRVRVASVAGRVSAAPLERGLARLAAAGLALEVDEDLLDVGHPYLAGPASQRAEALTRAFFDEAVDAVWCARGGYGAMHLLGRVDFRALAETGKAFVGFSDITALHLALNRAGLATVHGPVVTALGASEEAEARWVIEAVLRLLTGGLGAGRVMAGEARGGGVAAGPLVGGNLSLLAPCLPCRTLAPPAGCVLLIEDVNEPLYRLDRLVTGLHLAGALDDVAGFAVGSFVGCGGGEGGPAAASRLVAGALASLGRPVVSGLPIGHGPRDEPVALGLPVTLDGEAGTLCWPGDGASGG